MAHPEAATNCVFVLTSQLVAFGAPGGFHMGAVLMLRTFGFMLLAGCLLHALPAATRYHQYSEQFRHPKQPATPLLAGYIGGSSDEYLIDAAVLPDGTVLLAGNCYGEGYAVDPAPVRVLGTDTAAPRWSMPTKKNKRGDQMPPPPNWHFTQGARLYCAS